MVTLMARPIIWLTAKMRFVVCLTSLFLTCKCFHFYKLRCAVPISLDYIWTTDYFLFLYSLNSSMLTVLEKFDHFKRIRDIKYF